MGSDPFKLALQGMSKATVLFYAHNPVEKMPTEGRQDAKRGSCNKRNNSLVYEV